MLALLAAVGSSLACLEPTPIPPSPLKPTELVDAIVYSSRGDNRLHLIDAADLKPIASIDVGLGAHETAVSSDGRWLMGSAYGGPGAGHQPADNRIVIVDITSGKVHKTITLAGMQRPNDIAFVRGTSRAVITVEVPPHLVVLDAQTGETRPIPIELKHGHMLALDPQGAKAYVAHVMPGALGVVDLAAGKVTSSLDLPLGAEGIALSPDAKSLWIASNRAGKVSIVDTATNQVRQTLDCAGFPFRARFAPGGKSVAMSCPGSGQVAIFDASDPTKVQRIDVLPADAPAKLMPTALAFVPGDDRLAVLCEGDAAQIVLLSTSTSKVERRTAALGPIADALTAGRIRRPSPS